MTICNFCLKNNATINLGDKYNILFLSDPTLNETAWACEECHQIFRRDGALKSKKGFSIIIP
jgi:hypothetical protein